MSIDKNTLQLLQNESPVNRSVGVQVAWGQEWGTMDIFDELPFITNVGTPWEAHKEKRTWQVGRWALIATDYEYKAYFLIVFNRVPVAKATVDRSKSKKTFEFYKREFMDFILAEND